ncbi:hypothetical protein VTK26DRAFT_1006 [Humicola hyalothermophila]
MEIEDDGQTVQTLPSPDCWVAVVCSCGLHHEVSALAGSGPLPEMDCARVNLHGASELSRFANCSTITIQH